MSRHSFRISVFIIICIAFAVPQSLLAEEIAKFGKVSDAELMMTSFEGDPEADAVVLLDIADVRIFDDFVLKFERRVRIKILTEEGKDRADVTIGYHESQKVDDIDAHSFRPNGKKTKLKGRDIHEEKVGSWRSKTFAIPGVEVGSIIEYRYRIRNEQYDVAFLEPWYFQNRDYTILSQISAVLKPGFRYNVFFVNCVDVIPSEDTFLEPGKKLTRFTWKMEDLPPIRKEPYMSTPKDYKAAIHFQMMSYKDAANNVTYIKDWESLVKNRYDHYKDFLDDEDIIEERVSELVNDSMETETVVHTLYEDVAENITTEKRGGWYVETKPKEVLKKGEATGAEKNMLLINMLNTAGIEAHPVLISTRNHGRILPNQPNMTQFNYLLAYAKKGTDTFLLDTSIPSYPYDLMPLRNLVNEGLLIKEGPVRFLKIPNPRKINMWTTKIDAQLDTNGNLTATADLRLEGYRGVFARNSINSDGQEDYVKELLSNRFENVVIDSFKFGGIEEKELPLNLKIHYQIREFAQVVGGMMYLTGPSINTMEDNPLESKTRYFPVEYSINRANTEEINLTLPPGMEVEELPKGVINRQKGISFINMWKEEAGTIKIQRQYMRRKLTFKTTEYQSLRDFFASVVKSDQKQLVLRPATATAGGSQ